MLNNIRNISNSVFKLFDSNNKIDNLILFPSVKFLGLSGGLLIVLLFVFLLFSTLFTLIPIAIYRNKSISDELREE